MKRINQDPDAIGSKVFFSLLEIYNEKIFDLLSSDNCSPLEVRDDQKGAFNIPGATIMSTSWSDDVSGEI